MSAPRILVAGVGNIFFGDDGFGVEVAQRLAERPLPDGVCVVDFGIRSMDLAYALLDGYDAVILVDALPRGGMPGTLHVLELDMSEAAAMAAPGPMMEPHTLDPWRVLGLAHSLGGQVKKMLLVGCEPQPPDPDDLVMELSVPVQTAVQEALDLIESLIMAIRSEFPGSVETPGAQLVVKGT